ALFRRCDFHVPEVEPWRGEQKLVNGDRPDVIPNSFITRGAAECYLYIGLVLHMLESQLALDHHDITCPTRDPPGWTWLAGCRIAQGYTWSSTGRMGDKKTGQYQCVGECPPQIADRSCPHHKKLPQIKSQ